MAGWTHELELLVAALRDPPAASPAAEIPQIEPGVGAELARWLDLLALWNAKTDLTGAKTPAAMADVMVGDALVLATMIPQGARLLDVGAGAGGPTIPLVLLRRDLCATLLEPRARRVAFLRTSVGSLGLVARVRVVAGKLDEAHPERTPGLGIGEAEADRVVPVGSSSFAPIDVALSRATFAPEVWLPLGLAIAARVVVLSTAPLAAGALDSACEGGCRLEVERSYRSAVGGSPRWAGLFARGR